jgi:hypothetical protein
MESILILENQGSEMVEYLLDDKITEEYNILDWYIDDKDDTIHVIFKDKDHRFNFQCDNNINLEGKGYIS